MSKSCPELARKWQIRIEKWKSSGKSKAQWCRDNGVSCYQFYYWVGRLFPKSQQQSERSKFVEISDGVDQESGFTIECNGVKVHLQSHFHDQSLLRCLELIRRLPC